MSTARFRGAIPLALLAAFVGGVAIDGWLRTYGPPKPVKPGSEAADAFIAAPPKKGSDLDFRGSTTNRDTMCVE